MEEQPQHEKGTITNEYLTVFRYAFGILIGLIGLVLLFSSITYITESKKRTNLLPSESVYLEHLLDGYLHNISLFFAHLNKEVGGIEAKDFSSQEVSDIFIERLKELNQQGEIFITKSLQWVQDDKLLVNRNIVYIDPLAVKDSLYLRQAKQHPSQLHFGSQYINQTTGKWILPISYGVMDSEGNYLGTILSSINLEQLNKELWFKFRDIGGNYVVLTSDFRQLVDMSHKISSQVIEGNDFFAENTEGKLKQAAHYLESPISYNGVLYNYYMPMQRYPLNIMMGYTISLSEILFNGAFILRLTEFLLLGLAAGFILYSMRKRIVNPVMSLAYCAEEISKGNEEVEIPDSKTYEVHILAEQLKKVRDFVSHERQIKEQLAIQTDLLERKTEQLERAKAALENSNMVLEKRTEQLELTKEEAMVARNMAEQANKAKSEFLANMSHELRTPLFTINGYSEMLVQQLYGDVRKDHTEAVEYIHTAGKHLLQLIDDILDLAKAESGKLQLDEKEISIKDNIERCVNFIKQQALDKQVNLQCHYAASLPNLYVDQLKFRQVILNLLDNAIKYSPANTEILVSAWLDKGELFISVKDQGEGMDEEDIPEVLTDFGKVRSSQTRKANQGTGLGLPMVKTFVELHQGALFIDSIKGKGTTAVVKFPTERLIGNVINKHKEEVKA